MGGPLSTPSLVGASEWKLRDLILNDRGSEKIDQCVAQVGDDTQETASSSTNIDKYILATFAIPAAIWIAKQFVGSFAGRRINEAVEKIEKVILPKKMTGRQEIIDTTMRTAGGFAEAVKTIKNGDADMTHTQALEAGIRFIYSHDGKYKAAGSIPDSIYVLPADIAELREWSGLTNDQILNVLYGVNREYGKNYQNVWNDISAAVAESPSERHALVGVPKDMTDTQEIMRRGVSIQNRLEREMVMDLFTKLVKEMGNIDPNTARTTVNVSGDHVSVNDPARSSETMLDVISKLASGEELSRGDIDFIQNLKSTNPSVQKLFDVVTLPIKERTESARQMAKLLNMSEDGSATAKGLAKFTRAILENKTNAALLIVNDEQGIRILPRQMIEMRDGSYSASYERPYYVGPYTYEKADAYTLNGEQMEVSSAVVVTDGRGMKFFIAENDMAHFREMAKALSKNPVAASSQLGKSFSKFFMAAESIFLSADSSYKPLNSSPELFRRATAIANSSWGSEFNRELGLMLQDLYNIHARSMGYAVKLNGEKEAVQIAISERIDRFQERYRERFPAAKRGELKTSLNKLRYAMLKEDTANVELETGNIRKMIVEQLGGSKVAILEYPNLPGSIRTMRRININDFIRAAVSGTNPSMKDFASTWGPNQGEKPRLEIARELWTADSRERALAEYEALANKFSIDSGTRMAVLAELAERSYENGEILRCARALDKIDQMRISGTMIPEEAAASLKRLFSTSKTNAALRAPAELRNEVLGAMPTPERPVITSGMTHRTDLRFAKMPPTIQEQITELALTWSGGDLFGYEPDYLIKIATCQSPREVKMLLGERYKESLTNAEIAEEMALLEPFMKSAMQVTEPLSRLRTLPKDARASLGLLIAKWQGDTYDKALLERAAVFSQQELMDVFGYKETSEIFWKGISEFQSEARSTIAVSTEAANVAPPKQVEVKPVEAEVVETQPAQTRTLPINAASSKAKTMVKTAGAEVVGPALFGAATFLAAGETVEFVLPKPESQLEAVVYGYDVVGTSVILDNSLQKLAYQLVWKKTLPTAFSFGKFTSGMGLSVIAYKGIEATAKKAGASQETAEVVGLVGTGVAYGVAGQISKKVAIGGLAKSAALSGLTKGASYYIPAIGQAYFIVDTITTGADAIISAFDGDIRAAAKNEWYLAGKEYNESRAIGGSAEDVPWYERLGYSALNMLDTFVPAGWHKLLAPLDDQSSDWIRQCELNLSAGNPCR